MKSGPRTRSARFSVHLTDEVAPSCAAGRCSIGRPENPAEEDAGALPLSYAWLWPNGGARTRSLPISSRRNPYLRSRPVDQVGLGTGWRRTLSCVLSGTYPARAGRAGFHPRPCGHMIRRNPRLRSRPTIRFSRSVQLPGIASLRGQGSNLSLLLQGQAWSRFHHLASV